MRLNDKERGKRKREMNVTEKCAKLNDSNEKKNLKHKKIEKETNAQENSNIFHYFIGICVSLTTHNKKDEYIGS